MAVDHLNRNGLMSDKQYEFHSSWFTAYILTVITHRIREALDYKFIITAITFIANAFLSSVTVITSIDRDFLPNFCLK